MSREKCKKIADYKKEKIEDSLNEVDNSEYIKSLSEDIKKRRLDNHILRDFFDEIVGHLQSEGCSTTDNYAGKYYEVMPLFLRHYDDVARPERLAKYQKIKMRNIMDKLNSSIETSDIKHIRPEVLKMVLNYITPKNLEEDPNTIKVVFQEV